jgi:putative ABC transport system permease protein
MTSYPIGYWQLFASVCLVLCAGLVSAALGLGLLRSLMWGTVRTFVQLTLIGHVLAHVFAINHPALVAALVTLMVLLAARASVARMSHVPFSPHLIATIALAASTFIVGSSVSALIVSGDSFATAHVAIPIAGMLLGNALNGVSLSLDRFFAEVRSGSAQIEQRLALGYEPFEAIRPQLKAALRAGMLPTINTLMVVGIVSLPGMMTGQILAGADPVMATRYQIVIMMMVAASVAIGSLVMVGLSHRRCFTADDALLPELLRSGD